MSSSYPLTALPIECYWSDDSDNSSIRLLVNLPSQTRLFSAKQLIIQAATEHGNLGYTPDLTRMQIFRVRMDSALMAQIDKDGNIECKVDLHNNEDAELIENGKVTVGGSDLWIIKYIRPPPPPSLPPIDPVLVSIIHISKEKGFYKSDLELNLVFEVDEIPPGIADYLVNIERPRQLDKSELDWLKQQLPHKKDILSKFLTEAPQTGAGGRGVEALHYFHHLSTVGSSRRAAYQRHRESAMTYFFYSFSQWVLEKKTNLVTYYSTQSWPKLYKLVTRLSHSGEYFDFRFAPKNDFHVWKGSNPDSFSSVVLLQETCSSKKNQQDYIRLRLQGASLIRLYEASGQSLILPVLYINHKYVAHLLILYKHDNTVRYTKKKYCLKNDEDLLALSVTVFNILDQSSQTSVSEESIVDSLARLRFHPVIGSFTKGRSGMMTHATVSLNTKDDDEEEDGDDDNDDDDDDDNDDADGGREDPESGNESKGGSEHQGGSGGGGGARKRGGGGAGGSAGKRDGSGGGAKGAGKQGMNAEGASEGGGAGNNPNKRRRKSEGRGYPHDKAFCSDLERAGYTVISTVKNYPWVKRVTKDNEKFIAKSIRGFKSQELHILEQLTLIGPVNTIPLHKSLGTCFILREHRPIVEAIGTRGGGFLHGRWDQMAMDLCRGLNFLHNHQIAHLDIKPDNLVFDGNQLLIIDFSIAMHVANPKRLFRGKPGSLDYQAPEIVKWGEFLPFKADLYSCGYVLMLFADLGHHRELRRFASQLCSDYDGDRPSLSVWLSRDSDYY